MTKRSRVELFEEIRRARRLEPQVSIRELGQRFGTYRRTVREASASAVPTARRPVVRLLAVLLLSSARAVASSPASSPSPQTGFRPFGTDVFPTRHD